MTGPLPLPLREYLCVDDEGICTTDLKLVVAGDEIERVTRTKDKVLVTFRLAVPTETTETELVFRVGSIVDGTDAEVCQEVVLPCTKDQIDKAIEFVASAANALAS